ncbi:hypothetical protein J1N35_032921 [Gossypium stocksii]|uniref:Uncharacterized protein n=1 Tax=Gossypium stocksii TaxID=47602 RepID=A0A9D3V5F4_9ROSI|nr:hypothetical protein J1N35_032921 [Gossypium stocksii]
MDCVKARNPHLSKRIFDTTCECMQRVKESEDPEEAEDDPTEIEPEQSAKAPNKAEPTEPEAEPDTKTSMFRTLPPSPDLRDELSELMDLMQHMQWQQQAYWRYSKIRDDSMRSTLRKIYNDPFIFVPSFQISYLNHGVHYRRGSEAIHAKAIIMEQKMNQIRKDLQINKKERP